MSRRDHDDIRIRESENGPEVVFVSGQSGWVISCTEADLAALERRIIERRQAQATELLERQGR